MVLSRRMWVVSALASLAPMARTSFVFAQENEEPDVRVPSYRPPTRGAPGGRIGGGSRGSQEEIPTILVLAPDHKGLTSTPQPTVYWYISQATAGADLKLSVAPTNGGAPLLSRPFSGTIEKGIRALNLADDGITLQPDLEYEVRISFVSSGDGTKTMVSRGLIAFSEAKPSLKKNAAKAKPDDLPFIYASSGYWYDALHAVGGLIAQNPGNSGYRLMRAALLDQVRLHDPADLDREAAG